MREGTIMGIMGAFIYFQTSESTVPKNSNCSYLAPVSTDISALIAGVIVQQKGIAYNDNWLQFIGSAVAFIHVQQFLKHKAK